MTETVPKKLLSILGTIAGALLLFGLVFVQSVYPFISDSSGTSTCDDELAIACDTPGSLANFFVQVCGREEVSMKVGLIRRIDIGGDSGEPRDYFVTLSCNERQWVTWIIPEPAFNNLESGIQNAYQYADDDKTKDVMDIYERWATGLISTNAAKTALLNVE